MTYMKPTIYLDKFNGWGLIVTHDSGVIYCNQAGGFGCLHPQIEGVFVPLPVSDGRTEIHALEQHFRGNWHPISEEDAQFVDALLSRSDLDYIKVDRSRLAESYEAWVFVQIERQEEELHPSLLENFGSRVGVLVWLNSD